MYANERTRISRNVLVFLLLWSITIGSGSAFGEDKKSATSGEESSEIVLLVKGKNSEGKWRPLSGAVVNVFDSQGSQHQQKTTGEGRAVIKGLPRGKARVQVIAPEWEPFGKDYDLTKKKHDVVIELDKRKPK